MDISVFGANNPTGAYFLQLAKNTTIQTWGRKSPMYSQHNHVFCDLADYSQYGFRPLSGVLVSFAPIWLLVPFLNYAFIHQTQMLEGLRGIIACSSSSFITKRFAFNQYDQELVMRLETAHTTLISTSSSIGIPCVILAPTMVYGNVNGFCDRNISKLIEIMRLLPVVFLPSRSGLRQPIHASQLARVALQLTEEILQDKLDSKYSTLLTLGGDEILTYECMLLKIKNLLPRNGRLNNCKIVRIPEWLFYILAATLLPFNPKMFEAIMRIKSNLSGFSKAHEILGTESQSFPLLPLPIDK